MAKLYIVVTSMSAGNNLVENGRKKLSETEVKLTYCLTESQRQEVNAIRNKYRNRIIRNHSLALHSLMICNEEQKRAIETDIAEADKDMKNLSDKIYEEIRAGYGSPDTPEVKQLIEDIKVPDLHADANFFPLDSGEIAKGQLYVDIVNAIKAQIFDEAFKKATPVFTLPDGERLPTRTETALKKLCDRLTAINILDDEDVKEKIGKMREMIERESFVPLKEYIEAQKFELKQVTGRAAAVEL